VPIEMNLWRIEENRPRPLVMEGIDEEKRLESVIADDLAILGLRPLMLLGRQVATESNGRIDLLAIDDEGTLYIIELKRGRTPRDVVAQVLDYGAWARDVSAERLIRIFEQSQFSNGRTFHAAFADRFGGPPPAIINENHRLVIVASEMDSSTERIVDYLLDSYGVPVNVVFFRYFRDAGSEYLGRSWLKEPDAAEARARGKEPKRTPKTHAHTATSVRAAAAGGASRSSGSSPELACSFTTPTTDTSASGASWKAQYRSPNSPSPGTATPDRS